MKATSIPIPAPPLGTPPAGIVFEKTEAPKAPASAGKPLIKASGFETIKELEQEAVRPLRTFKADIEETVHAKQESVISIAAAEEKRRAARSVEEAIAPRPPFSALRLALIALSVLFILGGAAAIAFVLRDKSEEAPDRFVVRSPIFVDEAVELPMGSLSGRELLDTLALLRSNTALSLGLVRQIYPTTLATTGAPALAPAAVFLPRLAPRVPDTLVRTFKGPYLIGIHVFDGNQPFLLFSVSSYEQAYAALLSWEVTLAEDLYPFFARNPRPRTFRDATTTPPVRVIATNFRDAIVENRDVRILENEYGDILLLTTFLDRDTLLIATNEGTLREVVTRVKNAPLEERPDN